jgi:flagellar assembly factor FliW
MKIVTKHFGEVSFTDADVFEFPWGLPGFQDQRRFVVLSLAEQPSLVQLQSVDDPAIAIPAADPWQMFPHYDPRLPAYAREALELRSAEDLTVLCVVVPGKGGAGMTMNLLAPIVLNLKTRRARQIMLENSAYSIHTPVPREAVGQGKAQPA